MIAENGEPGFPSGPVLSGVIDTQYFGCVTRDPVDGDIREGRENEFTGAGNPADPAAVREQLQAHAPVINRFRHQSGSGRILLRDMASDAFEVFGSRAGPADLHQGFSARSTLAQTSSELTKSSFSAAAKPSLTASAKRASSFR